MQNDQQIQIVHVAIFLIIFGSRIYGYLSYNLSNTPIPNCMSIEPRVVNTFLACSSISFKHIQNLGICIKECLHASVAPVRMFFQQLEFLDLQGLSQEARRYPFRNDDPHVFFVSILRFEPKHCNVVYVNSPQHYIGLLSISPMIMKLKDFNSLPLETCREPITLLVEAQEEHYK